MLEAMGRLGGGAPVTQVALDLGYESVSAFSAMFRRAAGRLAQQFAIGLGRHEKPCCGVWDLLCRSNGLAHRNLDGTPANLPNARPNWGTLNRHSARSAAAPRSPGVSSV